MPISPEELSFEKEYLDKVMRFLLESLDKAKDTLERKKNEVEDLNKTMMDDIGNDVESLGKFVDAYSYLVEIGRSAEAMHNSEIEYARLNSMKDSPYFARMDFKTHDSAHPMKVYIGVNSLVDEENLDFYVFDWRSPIASMYYDYEKGEAKYSAPLGEIEGTITLKRQFKIWQGEINSIYDSSVAIGDEVLSEALSKSADSKMQSIVCTIQREQNKIIRNKESKYLIAFGPAGSGKTSVAMQRVAFFLYAYRDSIVPSNIVIFSPNNVFSDYISDVLPNLGEMNVKSTTFNDYASDLFKDKYKFLPEADLLEFSVNAYGVRKKAVELKLSLAFKEALDKKIQNLKSNSPYFPDMVYEGKCLMTGKEMDSLYSEEFSCLSVQARMNKLYARISIFAKEEYKRIKKELIKKTEEIQENTIANEKLIKEKWLLRIRYKEFLSYIKNILSASPEEIYLEVLKSFDEDVAEYTKKNLETGKPQSEDAAPLVYILSSVSEIKNEVKYLVLDEAQDYSALHFEAVKNCFRKANITFLGDTNQVVCPLAPLITGEEIEKVFPGAKREELTKSYRNTLQISEFCGKILGIENKDYMNRSGDNVTMTTLSVEEDYFKAMILDSLKFKEKNITSAIIFPTEKECVEIYEKYGKEYGLKLISGQDKSFVTGNIIIPSYMAKGLEFDAVLIPYKSYERKQLKNILYTSCTRALHILKLYKF